MTYFAFLCRPSSPSSAKELSLTTSEVFDKTDGNGAVAYTSPVHEARHVEDVASNHCESPNGLRYGVDALVSALKIFVNSITDR
jgi:hypothetical protein